MPKRRVLALGLIAAVGVSWGVVRAVQARRFEEGLAQARRAVGEGRFGEARLWLASLPPSRTSAPDVVDLEAVCEHAAGNYRAALAAWARIPPGSPLAPGAALARARTLIGDLGRFAEAERILEAAMAVEGPARAEVRHTLSQLYFEEGRRDAVRRLLREGWDRAPDPAAELRDLWMVDHARTLFEEVEAEVAHASALAPDDDRVWLARANLAVQVGRYDEAASWLDRCLARRPDDPAVWRARLDLARTSGDADGAARAAGHLPAAGFSEVEALDLRAWLAGRRGDAATERAALERLVAIDPAATVALDRLAALAFEAGDLDRSASYRRRKGELDRAMDRYRRLVEPDVPRAGYAELAALAEALGRDIETRGWWALRMRTEGDPRVTSEALARLNRPLRKEPLVARGTTLAGLVLPDPVGPAEPASQWRKEAHTAALAANFEDAAEAAGLVFRYDNGRSPSRQLPETTGGGVGLLDYDGDGWLDVFCVQGGPFPPSPDRPHSGDRLFRNRGDGTFEDATERAGIAALRRGYGLGVAVGDYDNDGDPDVFLTRWRAYALYRNRGDGTFEDATAEAGLDGDRDWPTSAALADLDGDGDLDLYVCHYLAWDAEHPTLCDRAQVAGERPEPVRRYDYCMPNPFPARPDHLWRNDGGRFVDVTAEAGIVDAEGRGLGVVAADLDGDGKTDLFVANDTTANFLFRNLGGLRFAEEGLTAGVACNADGAFQAGMGTAVGDLDGDGRPDLVVTNFYGESTSYFRNLGRGAFTDNTAHAGLAAPTRSRLGFGVAFLDANNDGWLDLAQANGHVVDSRPQFPYAMPAQLLLGRPSGRVVDATADAGLPWSVPRLARGLAAGDLDNDGRVDLLVVDTEGPLAYFRNRTEAPGHFLTLKLAGGPSNRDAVGAAVTVRAGGRPRSAWRAGGGSYLSASDPRLHFGLGTNRRADEVEVRWPSGRVDTYRDLAADAGYLLREGETAPARLAGFSGERRESARSRSPSGG